HPKCGAIHPEVEQGGDDDEDEIEVAFNQHSSGEGQRAKRAVGEKTCQVAAIADYRFYEHMGRSSIFKTANYIVTRSYSGVLRYFNTGWSSSKNGAGSTVTFNQQALLAAHEFGHSLGSEHDPSSGDCAPSSFFGDGKYLMYTYSVSGEDPNNGELSSCSINYINGVLSTKSSCFVVARGEQLCGNGRMDAGEECDGGFLGMVNQDTCCASDCTLRPGAFCSGSCLSGSCSGYCEYRGKISCVCDSVESFKTNMVACVTGFSLILYVPICIIIWCVGI
ncbi:ADA17-like protein, partial [Mya arenaria]